jgi:Radical SAM superfamily
MFTVDRRRVEEFCDAMLASGDGFKWSCSARTDCVDEELLEHMHRSGCRSIFFGVETGSERMQKIIDKHLDPRRAREIIDAAEQLGIHTTVSLITGFPEETRDDLRQTLRMFVHSARCPRSTPQLNLLAALAETPVYWKHRHELVLDELCSDVSHQGRNQDEADLELIRRYPEIFPNFYLLPAPQLDRKSLIELREFTLMATVRFRWLLCALDQATPDLLDFFEEWREHRAGLRPALSGPDLRQYYRTEQFRDDFLAFLRRHPVGGTEVVAALLDYHQALMVSSRQSTFELPNADVVERRARLRWTDIPIREKHTRVLELSCDLQLIIEALKKQDVPCWKRGRHFYATREFSAGVEQLHQVSIWVGLLLMACDGNRTIQQVVAYLSPQIVEVDESVRDYVFVQLVDGARAQGFINIYRPKSGSLPDAKSSSACGIAAHFRPAGASAIQSHLPPAISHAARRSVVDRAARSIRLVSWN